MKHRGKPQHIPLALLLLLAIWFDLAVTWGAEAPKPMRAIILFDVSGSMRQNDPQRLSVMAAQLFVDLAQPQDALAGVSGDEGLGLVKTILPQGFQGSRRVLPNCCGSFLKY